MQQNPHVLTANRLLRSLPTNDLRRVLRAGEIVDLAFAEVLYTSNEPIEHVYFPGGGFCY